jgi:hypothetical protein
MAQAAGASSRPLLGKYNGHIRSGLESKSRPAETDRGVVVSEADDQGCPAHDIATGKRRKGIPKSYATLPLPLPFRGRRLTAKSSALVYANCYA